ncbi:hypothetical protein F2P81_002159 [Scophthalmus maximus]|uniref:Uncharacterized protein n=1 Tax=Scophthalmus maximus TaxID=52904 RepID=A0A6A4TPY7_SCOMX|nr:hypothetical protein F2P81_002159 [Scophthalmus maximus]
MQMDLWPPRSFSSVKWDTPPDMCLGVPQSCRFQRELVVPAGEEGRGGADDPLDGRLGCEHIKAHSRYETEEFAKP